MIRIAITAQAFDIIVESLPLGSVAFEAAPTASGERLIWIDPRIVDRLAAMRGKDESYSDVIIRIAAIEARR